MPRRNCIPDRKRAAWEGRSLWTACGVSLSIHWETLQKNVRKWEVSRCIKRDRVKGKEEKEERNRLGQQSEDRRKEEMKPGRTRGRNKDKDKVSSIIQLSEKIPHEPKERRLGLCRMSTVGRWHSVPRHTQYM